MRGGGETSASADRFEERQADRTQPDGAHEKDSRRRTRPHGRSDQEWQEARRRLAIIQHRAATPERTRSSAADAARELKLSVPLTYRLLHSYQQDPRVTNFLPARRGRKQGRRLLTPVAEEIIQAAIAEVSLSPGKNRDRAH